MTATLLQLVQRTMGQLNLAVPTAAVGSTSQDVQQVVALASAVGQELATTFPWTGLQRQHLFLSEAQTQDGTLTNSSAVVTAIPSTAGLSADWGVSGVGIPPDTRIATVDSPTQVTLTAAATTGGVQSLTFSRLRYPLPADFQNVINRTQWDRSRRWEMVGPLTPQQWQYVVSGQIASGPRVRWRIVRNAFEIWPAQGAGERLGFEYISDWWVNPASGVGASVFANDADTCIYLDALMVAAMRFKYLTVKGFDTTQAQRDFLMQLYSAQAQDGGASVLSMGGRFDPVLWSWDQIPDSGYGPA